MRWLVDGYNVIRADPDLHGAEEQGLAAGRAALLRRIVEAERRCGDPFTVVFDGAPAPGPVAVPGRVEVVFSRPPRTADDVLVDRARALGAGAIVVTSDQKVQSAVRRAGATAVAAERFLAALAGPMDDTAPDGDDDEDEPRRKAGNPRRVSREERAVRRALRRLAGR
jgi:predicted RNA-binding protein with PIN domain